MRSIRGKIVTAFLVVILVMIVLSVSIVVIDSGLINRYNQINENIIYEQAFKDNIWLLSQDWYNGAKSHNYSDYYRRLEDIKNIQKTLDSKFTGSASQETRVAYRSLNRSLESVIEDIKTAEENWEIKGEIIGLSEVFREANTKLEFVKQNITDLLLIETKNVAEVTRVIQKEQVFLFIIIGAIIFLMSIFSIFLSVFFAKKITNPIIDLSETVRRISGGDLTLSVNKNLFKNKDEIGSLAKSFDSMVVNLREKISALEISGKKLDKKIEELSISNIALKETKVAIMNLLEDARRLSTILKEERDRIQTIVSSMGEGLIVVDKKNQIILVNPVAGKLLKRSPGKLIGDDVTVSIPLYSGRKEVLPVNHPIVRAIKNKKTIISSLEDDFYLTKSSGQKFPVLMVVAPLFREEVTGAVMMFRDASEEKALDEAKVGFISVASHQLRTPLTSMRWFSEMLIDGDAGKINDEQKHFIERIYQGTERMINLVNLLLQIARVEAGRLKIEPVLVDFKNTTQGVAFTLKASLEAKAQKVVIETEPDPFPAIPMDQEVIWQVIQNLLANASAYSPPKSTIYISIVKKGKMVEYSVKDQGIGIPKEHQSRIFEKFYRAENALKLVPEGSGLGLSLVKMLVERWGGKIWFESKKEGKGTTFYFTIPFEGMEHKEGEVGLGV